MFKVTEVDTILIKENIFYRTDSSAEDTGLKSGELKSLKNFSYMRYIISFFILFVCANGYSQSLPGKQYIRDYSQLPLKQARTISFTTSVSSLLDVDISPDGHTILFTILGDLFAVPSKGGKAIQLTRGLAINRWPMWSPDGKYIAFVSDATGEHRLHIRNLEGSFHKVLGEKEEPLSDDYEVDKFEPIWLPEENNIFCNGVIYNLSGFKTQLLSKSRKDEFSVHTRLVGFTKDSPFVYFVYGHGLNIKRYNRLTGEITTVIDDQTAVQFDFCNNARVSPDGHWLAYLRTRNQKVDSLMLYNIDTKQTRSLAKLDIESPGRIGEQRYTFSSDSKEIYIGYGGKIHRINISNGKNEIIPFSADVKIDLGPLNENRFTINQDSVQVKYMRSAHRSPDGKKLVFCALNSIYLMDLPNGKPYLLTKQAFGQFEPAFSPDGKWIAYVAWQDKMGGSLWKVSSTGGTPEQLSKTAGIYEYPSWSPDGKLITVKYSSFDWKDRIQIFSANGDMMETVADTCHYYNLPTFSSDGTRVIYTPIQKGGANEINPRMVSKAIEGSDIETIVIGTGTKDGFTPTFEQMLISPDERYLVYMWNENLYLVPVIKTGKLVLMYNKNEDLPMIRFAADGIDPHWEQGGKILSWSYGNKYYNIDPDKIVQAAFMGQTVKDTGFSFPSNIIDVRIKPAEVVDIHLKYPAYYGKGTIAFKNARIITMQGNKVIETGTVIIKNGKIQTVGGNHIPIPVGAKVLDVQGKTIMPGLVDLHAHISSPGYLSQEAPMFFAALAYGVTTARNPSSFIESFGLAELVESGKMTGPRYFSVGKAVRAYYDVNNLQEAKIIVNNRKQLGANVIKQYILPERIHKEWLLMACRQAGINMTNEGNRLPLDYIGMIKDGSSGVEHNPIWGDVYSDVITFLAKSGTYITPTPQVTSDYVKPNDGKYYFRNTFKPYNTKLQRFTTRMWGKIYEEAAAKTEYSNLANFGFVHDSRINAEVLKRGGKIGVGSHSEDWGIGMHFAIWAMQMGGMSNMDVLKCATINGAEALGLQQYIGSIERGKIADLIILDQNPLDDIHNTNTIRYVMKDGVLYYGNTLDTVWPIQKKLPDWRLDSTIKADAFQ